MVEPNTSFKVLGVRVDAVQIPDVIRQMEQWIAARDRCHYIAVTGMHGVTEAQHDPELKDILNAADLVVPDGMPLVWLGRWRGFRLKRRVYGPELLLAFCEQTAGKGYRHFFYGGAPGVAESLAETLRRSVGKRAAEEARAVAQLRAGGPSRVVADLEVAGTLCPPFRPLTAVEQMTIVGQVRNAAPDVLWVGLSTPKQERWMYEQRDKLQVSVMVGVGAAFDLLTGRVKQAPAWMREHGLEWFWRLLQEPRRLWRRYLLGGSEFVCCVALELLGLKTFERQTSAASKQ